MNRIAALLLACAPVFGATVWDNGTPNATSGNEMTNWIQAENFTLGSATTIEGIQFWAFLYGGSYSGSITWQILSDASGVPGSVLFSDTVSVTPTNEGPLAFEGSDRLRFDINAGGVALAAGDYWLAIHNGPLSNLSGAGMYWQTTGASNPPTGQEQAGALVPTDGHSVL